MIASSFQELPREYKNAIRDVSNKIIQKIYSKFSFFYYKFSQIQDNNNSEENQISHFIDVLINFKFITYYIIENNTIIDKKVVNKQCFNLILCCEGHCFIIEQIDIEIINKIISDLKKYSLSLLSVDKDEFVKEEIYNFCKYFNQVIMHNIFVKLTINPISCYMIRRYFYPSDFFNDSSFFSFDEINCKEYAIKKQLAELILCDECKDDKVKDERKDCKEKDENKNDKENDEENDDKEEQSINTEYVEEYENAEEEEEMNNSNFDDTEQDDFYNSSDDNKSDNEEIEDDDEEDEEDKKIYENKICEEFDKNVILRQINPKSFKDKLTSIEKDAFDNSNNLKNIRAINFDKKDFIILRFLYGNTKAYYYLVIHLQSLYIFMMKNVVIDKNSELPKEITNEYDFCKSFRHRCLVRFYGFLYDRKKFAGFIYEYMCNDSLNSFVEKNNDKLTEIYKTMIINRIFQGIHFFHSKTLIHRDLKPLNILINHDFLPYISDFETVRHPSDEEMTTNIGSSKYSSPEQYSGRFYSYPTDIFAFGKIINFLYESNIEKSNCSEGIKNIYELCVKHSPSERPTITTLMQILFDEVNSYYYFEEYFMNSKYETKKTEISQFFYENIILQHSHKSLYECFDKIYYFFYLNKIKSLFGMQEIYFTAGYYYSKGKYVNQDFSKSKFYYELSAKSDNPKALYNLGLLYKNGYGVKQDYYKAKNCFQKSAKMRNSSSYYSLGILYEKGLGVQRNYWKAKKYYELANKYRNDSAHISLGNLYYYGKGVDQNFKKAKEYYKCYSDLGLYNLGVLYLTMDKRKKDLGKSLKIFNSVISDLGKINSLLGDLYFHGIHYEQSYEKAKEYYEYVLNDENEIKYYPKAINNLGYIYLNGLSCKQDYEKAKKCFEMTAKNDDSDGLLNLGEIYENGEGVVQDYAKAKYYYGKAAQKNNTDALFHLGNFYYNGLGVKKDELMAEKYYEQLAQKNDSDIFIELGDLYSYGHNINQDYSKARKYYELAAKQDNLDAYFKLALLYYHGRGVPKDLLKAKQYYDSIFSKSISNHYVKLADIYENGHGVVIDKNLALSYYEKASQLNNSKALLKLGDFYLNTKKEYSKAKEYYQLSADQNNAEALFKLGNIYEYGYGVEVDYLKAKNYYQLSSLQNNSKATFQLGYFYLNGYGITKSYIDALIYFKYSAKYFNNPSAFFYVGYLYSTGDFFDINDHKAIKYYKICSKIEYEEVEENDLINQKYSMCKLNKFHSRSKNDIGLIFLLNKNKIEKSRKYLQRAAFDEYPFAQNNYGLFNQLHLNNFDEAIYMYQKASKSHFSLSFYNQAYIIEVKNNYITKESLNLYIEASDNEDSPMIFRNYKHFDKRLEISKSFIICYTNLKLTLYYLMKSNNKEAKKFFIKSFSKIKSYQFDFKIQNEKSTEKLFSYFKSFILKHPLFNLINQPNLTQELLEYLNSLIEFSSKKSQSQNDNKTDHSKNNDVDDSQTKLNWFNSKLIHIKDKIFNKFIKDSINSNNSNTVFDSNKNQIIELKSPDDLFDFATQNDQIKGLFTKVIEEISNFMKKLLYNPPYFILFGRILLPKPKNKQDIQMSKLQKPIDKSFYEGFGINE